MRNSKVRFHNPRVALLWPLLAGALILLSIALQGSDINKGYSWTPTDRVTSTKLNNEVDLATINTTFITDKTVAAPVAADSILYYQVSSGVFRQATFQSLLIGNTNLIVLQTEDTAPQTNDFVLTYDASANTFAKVSLGNLVMSNRFLLASQYEDTNAPAPFMQFLVSSNGIYSRKGLTNILSQWWRWMPFANASNAITDPTNFLFSAHTKPTNSDAILIWDSRAQTNKYITLAGLATNVPTVTVLTNSDTIPIFSTATNLPSGPNQFGTNPIVANVTTATLSNYFTAPLWAKVPQKFVTNTIALGSGLLVNGAHGLAGTPQSVRWVLVQTNSSADLGWGQNREVDIASFFDSSTGKAAFATDADSSSVILIEETATVQTRSAVDGSVGNINTGKWVAKGYFTYFP